MSRATDALLAAVKSIDPKADAANDDVSSDIETAVADEPQAVPLTTWIDALAMTLAAGLRVGATGLDRAAGRGEPLVGQFIDARNDQVSGDGDGDVLTVDDVAELLKVGRNAVYESVGRNEIPHRRIGKQIRFSRRAIVRWLDSWSSQGAKEGK